MAKYFLGSVGTAEAFRMVDQKPVLAFVSKTLTDSGINISTTKDDIRAGTNAPVQFSFYHDSNVDITLTDVLFKPEYVEAQLGVKFEADPQAYVSLDSSKDSDKVTVAAGTLTISEEILPLPLGCGQSERYAWYTETGADNWTVATVTEDGGNYVIAGSDIQAGKHYCVRFLGTNESARVATITSEMIPEELFLVITAPIFAGDACAASNGKIAGEITFEVPRFRLAGAQDFAMAMSSNQTMSLSGTAMAVENGCDVNGSTLLRIREVITGRKLYDGAISIYSDGEATPGYWFVYKNGTVKAIDGSGYSISVNAETNMGDVKKGDTTVASLPIVTD